MKIFSFFAALALIMSVSSFSGGAQTLKPLRIDTPPTIDGSLEDAAWSAAPSVSDFVTFAPDFGKKQEEKTVVFMAYDSENLYFAFQCFDDPGKIKTSLASRDNIRPDDWICINLDTFGDQQGLTALYVNPSGIQMDSRFAAGVEDFSADLVWYSAGRMTQDGYNIEVQIPLKSIRYSDDEVVTMTVFFERYISRRTEHGSFPELDPARGFAFLQQMSPMEYTGLEHYTLVEVLPAVVFNQQFAQEAGTFKVQSVKREGSLTLKYGITSDLIVDATLNPDFSQVEADAGQVDVNLRNNLFFSERRPFFLEGREHFNVGAAESGAPLQALVHTRTIVDPLVGVRLTGKISTNQTVAGLFANDELNPEKPGDPNEAQFGVARYKLALNEDSYVGTALAGRKAGAGYNGVGGFDGQIRVTEGSMFDFHGFLSEARDSSGGSTSRGHAVALRYQLGNRDLEYSIKAERVTDDFRADMGFRNRIGVMSFSGSVLPRFYPTSSFVQRVGIGLFTSQTQDLPSSKWETYNALIGQAIFAGSMSLSTQVYYSTEVFLGTLFRTSGAYASVGGQITPALSVSANARFANAIYYAPTPFQGRGSRLQASVVYQPTEQIRFDYSFVFSDFHRSSDDARIYEYPINRVKAAYQYNKYLFFRVIGEYNGFRRRLLTDFLASFTYIPGTVLHAGYGSVYQRVEWDAGPPSQYRQARNLLEMNRGLFFKASYLWRL